MLRRLTRLIDGICEACKAQDGIARQCIEPVKDQSKTADAKALIQGAGHCPLGQLREDLQRTLFVVD